MKLFRKFEVCFSCRICIVYYHCRPSIMHALDTYIINPCSVRVRKANVTVVCLYGAPNAAKFEGRQLDIERTKSISISISTVFFQYKIDVAIDIDSVLSIRNRCCYQYRQCSSHTKSISMVCLLFYQPRRINKGHSGVSRRS